MKYNYANRQNDKNIIEKKVTMLDSNYKGFEGKITLIEINKVNKKLIVDRPNGIKETVIDKNYKIMTYFPTNDKYSMTVMIDNNFNILQWYFDINKYKCKYEDDIPYSEDLFLDVVLLPTGEYYTLDEEDLEIAYKNKLISLKDYKEAYKTRENLIKQIKENFKIINDFTKSSLIALLDN